MSISAENINNLGGQLSADQLSASARQDLNNLGGLIEAGSAAQVTAGRDFNLAAASVGSPVADARRRPTPGGPRHHQRAGAGAHHPRLTFKSMT
jgi:adhesin HecA-like repeat protein